MDGIACKIQNLGGMILVLEILKTWIADKVVWVEIPGFSAHHSVRFRTTAGGVTVVVDSDLESNLSSDLLKNNRIHENEGSKK